jgi:catechol 2,3-dioxygenase-like lactoylglutathione lyase family enzyme
MTSVLSLRVRPLRAGALALASILATTAAAGAGGAPAGEVAVESIGIVVSDLDEAIGFYTRVLEFNVEGTYEAAGGDLERFTGVFAARCLGARLSLGEESIDLVEYLAPQGRAIPADSRGNDRWFQHIAIVVSDMDAAYARLRAHRVRHASSGPQRLPEWNPNAGGISAFYFKDPDGHTLEVIHFPAGKGDARWQGRSDALFLGIDHTAIVVADTERSIGFYGDALGLRVAGASENYGTEQEHLNAVFGARVRITALRGDRGPGVELLEYISPGDGRAYPPNTRACDLWSWSITMVTPDGEEMHRRLRQARATWVSPGIVPGVDGMTPFGTGCHVRDPDGHALWIGHAARGEAAGHAGHGD